MAIGSDDLSVSEFWFILLFFGFLRFLVVLSNDSHEKGKHEKGAKDWNLENNEIFLLVSVQV